MSTTLTSPSLRTRNLFLIAAGILLLSGMHLYAIDNVTIKHRNEQRSKTQGWSFCKSTGKVNFMGDATFLDKTGKPIETPIKKINWKVELDGKTIFNKTNKQGSISFTLNLSKINLGSHELKLTVANVSDQSDSGSDTDTLNVIQAIVQSMDFNGEDNTRIRKVGKEWNDDKFSQEGKKINKPEYRDTNLDGNFEVHDPASYIAGSKLVTNMKVMIKPKNITLSPGVNMEFKITADSNSKRKTRKVSSGGVITFNNVTRFSFGEAVNNLNVSIEVGLTCNNRSGFNQISTLNPRIFVTLKEPIPTASSDRDENAITAKRQDYSTLAAKGASSEGQVASKVFKRLNRDLDFKLSRKAFCEVDIWKILDKEKKKRKSDCISLARLMELVVKQLGVDGKAVRLYATTKDKKIIEDKDTKSFEGITYLLKFWSGGINNFEAVTKVGKKFYAVDFFSRTSASKMLSEFICSNEVTTSEVKSFTNSSGRITGKPKGQFQIWETSSRRLFKIAVDPPDYPVNFPFSCD